MAATGTPEDIHPPLQRFKLAVQRSRILFYTFASIVALLYEAIGVFSVGVPFILMLGSLAILSAVILYLTYRHWWRVNLDPLWFLLDGALVTWMVYATGGVESPWFPWYVASMSEAAVVGGFRWAVVMALLDSIGYMAVLMGLGQVTFPSDAFFHHLAVILSLFCAPAFFLWGTVELQRKRKIIKQLKENESHKVAELTRLTEALDQRTTELADANLKIRQADRMKSQFLANMSHELRTPLNSIIGFSEILQTRLERDLPDKYMRFLQNINASGEHLLGIINDLLDLSKIEAGKMEVNAERFSIESVLRGVCTIMKGIADKRGIEFELEFQPTLPALEADPVKVKQVFYNLLSNAVKFSKDKSTIRISARKLDGGASPLGEEALEVSIADDGIGIDPQFHEAIFDEFRQVDNTSTRTFGGTGLGLTLVKRFVELHRGQVLVDSSLGKGSVFNVTLPVHFKGVVGRTAETPPTLRTPNGLCHVLVVEDDPSAYEAVSAQLAKERMIAVRARFGEEAIRLARETRPAVITLDIILPDMDGWEVLKRLKEDPLTRSIPVVIVSLLDNRELGLALGAEDYFMKPIEGQAFIQRLKELVPPGNVEESTLLLIDDDARLHEMLDALLLPQGYLLDHAMTGVEGLRMASAKGYAIVILDLLMEEMDGFQVAQELKAAERTRDLPILVLTAKELTQEDRKRLSGKVTTMMQKGATSAADLVGAVHDLVQRCAGRAKP
jgi:signal transduction histidine kinase/CheY-like chemotaxis protein